MKARKKKSAKSTEQERKTNRPGRGPTARVTLVAGVVLLVLAGALASFALRGHESGIPITPAELAERIASHSAPLVLDVRSPREFASGHIPGARNIPFTELGSRLSELDLSEDDEVVVLCEVGGRAAVAATVLRASGYSNVRRLTGHMKAWRAGGYPLE
jgi:rhodanese-related sulfurtransferase